MHLAAHVPPRPGERVTLAVRVRRPFVPAVTRGICGRRHDSRWAGGPSAEGSIGPHLVDWLHGLQASCCAVSAASASPGASRTCGWRAPPPRTRTVTRDCTSRAPCARWQAGYGRAPGLEGGRSSAHRPW